MTGLTNSEAAELAALERLGDGVESVSDYIARMTPKYAPLPEHLDLVAAVLDAARDSPVCATISQPPRAGKTETLAHGLAHRITYDPACLNFYATFGDGLAKQTSRRVRRLVRAGGTPLSAEAQDVHDWRTIYDGGLKATSHGGDITGRGSNGGLAIADDLIKGRRWAESKLNRDTVWDWFRDDFMSREEPGCSFIVNMTRWHDDDIIGRLMRDALGYRWIHLEIPAMVGADGKSVDERNDPTAHSFWPRVFPLERLRRIRLRGEYGWWSLYQQRPTPRGGGIFKRDDFRFVDQRPDGGRWVRRWDLAASEDATAAFSAGVLVGLVDGALFVANAHRGQWSPAKRDAEILRTAREDGPGVEVWLPQDPGQAGLSQRPHFGKLLHGYNVNFERESVAKEIRWDPYRAQIGAHNVYLVRAGWNEPFLEEHELAPAGRVKDQIDAMAGAYYALIAVGETAEDVGGYVFDSHGSPVSDAVAAGSDVQTSSGDGGYTFTRDDSAW